MVEVRWPAPIRTLRGVLPAEMRVLRGAAGFLGGVLLVGLVFVELLGSNWQLGFRYTQPLTVIFLALIPGGIGIVSPLWYWLGRPVWYRLERPGGWLFRRWRRARFLPGLVGPLFGIWLFIPVSATSRFWTQLLIPLGLLVALASPLWWWVGRPLLIEYLEAAFARRLSLPDPLAGGSTGPLRTAMARLVPAAVLLIVVSAAVTAVISLPVVPMGEPVDHDGLVVTVSEPRSTNSLTEVEGEARRATDSWRFLLLRITVENRAAEPRPLPSASIGDVAVIAPECDAQTFGEPSNNCNQLYLDRSFSVDGRTFTSYAERREAAGRSLGPGETVTGWVAFRIEGQPVRNPDFEAMVIVEDISRWSLGEDWLAAGSAA